MKKYRRNQEKRNFDIAIIETFDFLFIAKRDERQSCTNFRESFDEFFNSMDEYEENKRFWFSYWQDATFVLYGNNKDASVHTCNCFDCIDSHLRKLFGEEYLSFIHSF